MGNEYLREQIKREVYFTSEAAEYLNISRQQINNIVKNGGITPIKSTTGGMIFLKEDLDNYSNKKSIENLFVPKKIIGDGVTRRSTKFFLQEMKDYENIVEVFAYFNTYDAINDGFYTTTETPKRDHVMRIEAPTMVIRYENMDEFWFDGFNAGYGGEGPHGTYDVLIRLGVPKEEAELVFVSNWVKYFKEGEKWRVINEFRDLRKEYDAEREWIYDMDLNARICSYNQNLVMVQYHYRKSWIEDEPEKFLKKYFYFVPMPVSVTLYTKEMAKATGHYICSTMGETYYQVVVKDISGRELWLEHYVDANTPINQQSSLANVLKALEIEIPDEKEKGLSFFIKKMLGTKIMINDYITLCK